MRIPKNFKKYELYNISVFSLLLLTVIYLNSCNLFFSNPHGRENINDSYAQLTAFTAVPSGDKSIVTMWNWRDAQSWTNDDVITEIKIQHSILGYPDNYLFFAGETFTDNNDWQYEWEDLISGITHYFSLFAKGSDNDGNDIWYAPIKSKAKLPGTSESRIIYSKDSLNIDNAGFEIWNPSPFLVTNTQWAVVYFDLPEDVFIVNASINVTIGGLSEIIFAPLDGVLPDDGFEKWDWLQNGYIVNEASAETFNINQASYDITEVVRAAVIGPEKAILIKTTDGSSFNITNNALSPNIAVDLIK